MHCVGCGREIGWNGKGLFAYTCPCGGTLFADEKGNVALPSSLVIAVMEGRELPHIDYYLGKSNYVSVEKQRVYEELRKRGAIWSWECDECRERVLQRKRMELKEGLYTFEVHPELKKLL